MWHTSAFITVLVISAAVCSASEAQGRWKAKFRDSASPFSADTVSKFMYTNSWAVQVAATANGSLDADGLASKYGLINLGQVLIVCKVYFSLLKFHIQHTSPVGV